MVQGSRLVAPRHRSTTRAIIAFISLFVISIIRITGIRGGSRTSPSTPLRRSSFVLMQGSITVIVVMSRS